MELLIKNGTLIDPSQRIQAKRDLWIVDGRVKKILKPGTYTGNANCKVIDAKGLMVAPGFIDIHTHLREPGEGHKETIRTGSEAAAAGGFTTIAAMANTHPVNDSPYITHFLQNKIDAEACVNVYPIGALSKGLKGEELTEVALLKEAGCVAISDDGMPVMNSNLMRKALDYSKPHNMPIISHAEDHHLTSNSVINEGLTSTRLGLRGNPAAAEEILVSRDIALSKLTGAHVHFAHISTAAAVGHIRRAKKEKLPISAEVTPHHLFLVDEDIEHYDTNFKMAPPLRTTKDAQALRKALKEDIIDAFATDHAPHSDLEKEVEFEHAANGVIGLETAFPITLKLVHNKVLTMSQFITKWTAGPSKILNLNKGTLKVGAEADVTIFDPNRRVKIDKKTFRSKSQNTPFHGWTCKGKICYTIVGGTVVYET